MKMFCNDPGAQHPTVPRLILIILRLLLIILFCKQVAYCQTPQPVPTNPQIIQPSPEAAKLGKYGNIQANLFNGTPNILVPIYELKIKDYTLPISLVYDASGIKVDELATNTGLGWSLNAGGVVTVAVRGRPDFNFDRFLPDTLESFDPNNMTDPGNGVMSDYQRAKSIVYDNVDTQQDMYYYNMSGYSGKFLFDQTLTNIVQIPYSNLRIEKKNGYTITTADGIIYQFSVSEFNGNAIEKCSVGSADPRNFISPYISSWYLKRIITPTGRTIVFDYEAVNVKYISGMDETRYVSPSGTPSGQCPTLTGKDRVCAKLNYLTQQRLKKISLDDSTIVINFTYDTALRQDMALDNINYGNSLKKIEVSNESGVIKRFTLSYDYFRTTAYDPGATAEANSLNCRLKLLSVTEDGKTPYTFTYNETENLPERTSMAMDSWGYFNGATNNNTLIPTDYYTDGRGANRKGSLTKRTAWMLQKITYPTGGYTSFTYEPHMAKENVTYTVRKTQALMTKQVAPNAFPLPTNFTVSQTYPTAVVNFNALGVYGKAAAALTGPNGLNVTLNVGESRQVYLSPGNYTATITRSGENDGFAMNVVAYYDSSYTLLEDMAVGGQRVAKIADYTTDGTLSSSQYFNYNIPGTSNSSLNYNHRHPYSRTEYVTRQFTDGQMVSECLYYVLASSPYPELGSEASETSIGYKYVTVTTDSLGTKGRIKYRFTTSPSDLIGDHDFSGASPEWCRGKLLETIHEKYNPAQSSWIAVQREQNIYKTNFHPDDYYTPHYVSEHEAIVPSFKLTITKPEITDGTITNNGAPAEFIYETFRYISAWVRLDQTDTYFYNMDSTLNVKLSKKYTYQNLNHVQPTAIDFNDSRGIIMKDILKYATDYSGQTVYDTMVRRNYIAPVIQAEKYSGTQLISLNKTNYSFFIGQKLTLPSSQQEQNGAGPLETTLQFQQYDSVGNLLQYAKPNDIAHSYIWGYDKNFPVAEILGVPYNAAIGLINTSVINHPSTDAALRTELDKMRTAYSNKAALISTYTYLPWVGMTSKTDANNITTYFEYDAYGRLKLIKDMDGKILNQFDYQYKVPVTQ